MVENTSILPAQKARILSERKDTDLNHIMVVRDGGGGFRSWAESLVDLPAGSLFSRITKATTKDIPTYATVQAGSDHHIELNSDLVYLNHSCVPTIECDMERMEMRVARDRDLKAGDTLSFFYPSTEWALAVPFTCWCGAGEGTCIGLVEGASKMDPARLRQYYLNGHIKEMLEKEGNKNN